MNPREKAKDMEYRHGSLALIQAQQCLMFDACSSYWEEVVKILSKK